MSRHGLCAALGAILASLGVAEAKTFDVPEFSITLPDGWLGPAVQHAGSSTGYQFTQPRAGSPLHPILIFQITDVRQALGETPVTKKLGEQLAQSAVNVCLEKNQQAFPTFHSDPSRACHVGGVEGVCSSWSGAAGAISMRGVCAGWVTAGKRMSVANAYDTESHQAETLPVLLHALETMLLQPD